jgi:hypothetical protein
MSAGLYIAAIMLKDQATLERVLADPEMVKKSADKYSIPTETARRYLQWEIDAKRAGK